LIPCVFSGQPAGRSPQPLHVVLAAWLAVWLWKIGKLRKV
jgi:hypothetical protein